MEKLLRRILFLVLIIFGLNTLASFFSWYVIFWWFDMPMHFAGGFFLMLLTAYIVLRYFYPSEHPLFSTTLRRILVCAGAVLAIGIFWELFEIIFTNIIGGLPFNALDTISDVCFDVAGASLGFLYLRYRYPFFASFVSV